MTPAARWATAAEILDSILAGAPAEKALTTWGRKSRFAGSKDRAAIRDHVFDALRCKRSAAASGGAMTGRGLVIGLLRLGGQVPAEVLTGDKFALPPLGPDDIEQPLPWLDGVTHDLQDWLWPIFETDLGDQTKTVAQTLRRRAPMFLRVNTARTDRATAREALAQDGIETSIHPNVETALSVSLGQRKVQQSQAYLDGLVEVQDAHSQAVVLALGDLTGKRVLDYCAGGGGKSLALAAQGAQVFAHDANPNRMKDLSSRAYRAGVTVTFLTTSEVRAHAPYDLVLADVPCSGSGAWRRQAEAKWQLTSARLHNLTKTQQDIIDTCQSLTAPGGEFSYVTCSLFRCENEDHTDTSLADAHWQLLEQKRWLPSPEGDGFFLSRYTRQG